MEKQILSVGQINEYIKGRLDNDPGLRNIAIRGELSNYKIYPSGHHYLHQGQHRCHEVRHVQVQRPAAPVPA